MNAIYKILCKDFGQGYIGETGRKIKQRKQEHKAAVQRDDTNNNTLANHCWQTDHRIDWDSAKEVDTENNWFRRKVKEASWIKKSTCTIQPDDGVLDHWSTILSRHSTE